VKGRHRLRKLLATSLLLAAALAAGCSSPPTAHHHGPVKLPIGPPGTSASGILRLGYQLNVPDAAALIATQMGYYQQNLGRVSLQPQPFTTTAPEITALETGQLDAAYLDPVSAVIAAQALHGGLRIIAGLGRAFGYRPLRLRMVFVAGHTHGFWEAARRHSIERAVACVLRTVHPANTSVGDCYKAINNLGSLGRISRCTAVARFVLALIQAVRRVRSAGSSSTTKGLVIRPTVPAVSVVRVTYRPPLREHATIPGVSCSSTRQ
jgi:hypothetical protein